MNETPTKNAFVNSLLNEAYNNIEKIRDIYNDRNIELQRKIKKIDETLDTIRELAEDLELKLF